MNIGKYVGNNNNHGVTGAWAYWVNPRVGQGGFRN